MWQTLSALGAVLIGFVVTFLFFVKKRDIHFPYSLWWKRNKYERLMSRLHAVLSPAHFNTIVKLLKEELAQNQGEHQKCVTWNMLADIGDQEPLGKTAEALLIEKAQNERKESWDWMGTAKIATLAIPAVIDCYDYYSSFQRGEITAKQLTVNVAMSMNSTVDAIELVAGMNSDDNLLGRRTQYRAITK